MTMLPLLSNHRFKLDETVLHKGAALHFPLYDYAAFAVKSQVQARRDSLAQGRCVACIVGFGVSEAVVI
jgi:hypothetical protein